MAQLVEYMPRNHETLHTIPSIAKKEKGKVSKSYTSKETHN
jgi:hypothetical protein